MCQEYDKSINDSVLRRFKKHHTIRAWKVLRKTEGHLTSEFHDFTWKCGLNKAIGDYTSCEKITEGAIHVFLNKREAEFWRNMSFYPHKYAVVPVTCFRQDFISAGKLNTFNWETWDTACFKKVLLRYDNYKKALPCVK